MKDFVYMRLRRDGKDLKPADLDSDEEREAIKFQQYQDRAIECAAEKNKDISKLQKMVNRELNDGTDDMRIGFSKREDIYSNELIKPKSHFVDLNQARNLANQARSLGN